MVFTRSYQHYRVLAQFLVIISAEKRYGWASHPHPE